MPVVQPSGALRTVATGRFVDAVFSRNGSSLYAVLGGSVSVIDVATGTSTANYAIGSSLGAIDLSADGCHLAVIEKSSGAVDTVYRIDLASGAVTTRSTPVSSGNFYDISFLNDGTVLISQQYAGTSFTPLRTLNFDTGLLTTSTSISLDNATLTASMDHSLVLTTPRSPFFSSYIYTAGQGITAQTISRSDPYAGASVPRPSLGVQAIAANGDLTIQGGTLNVYDGSLGYKLSLADNFQYLSGAIGLAFSPNADTLYMLQGGSAQKIIAFSTSTWDVVAQFAVGSSVTNPYDEFSGGIVGYGSALQASADGRYLSVIGTDGIQLMDLARVVSEGGPTDDLVTTTLATDVLYGFGGNDVLRGAEPNSNIMYSGSAMYGGAGNDTYYVFNYFDVPWEFSGQGYDAVHSSLGYTLGSNIEELTLEGTAPIGGYGNDLDNRISGNGAANTLSGFTGNDTIRGIGGDDVVGGGGGADMLYGGEGNDNLSSTEADFLQQGMPFSSDVGTEKDELFGGEGDDVLAIGYGDGADGGSGSDVLRLSLVGASAGVTLNTSILVSDTAYSLGGGTIQNMEVLAYLRGSELNDTITAATQASPLWIDGGEGDDTIVVGDGAVYVEGGAGNDLLIGGTGRLSGGVGNDTYSVFNSGAIVVEGGRSGYDTVYATTSYTLPWAVEVEVLSTASNAAVGNLALTGNDYSQFIIGDFGNNRLVGGGVAFGNGDVLIGLRGDDTYLVESRQLFLIENTDEGSDIAIIALSGNNFVLNEGSAVETLQAAAGTDAINITGNPGAQTLIGNDGANILSGAGGGDTLVGLGGDDVFQVRSLGDQVIEANGGGRDTVFATVSYNLGVNEVEVLSTVVNAATDAIDLIGNFASQLVIGNYGNNVLNGGSGGIDTLIGLRGDDLYAVGDGRTVIGDGAGEGTDTVVASVDYTLSGGAEIEVLAAQNRGGTEALTLRGNAFAQTVAGNEGANTIDGGGNMDTLVGGGGADVFAFTSGLSALNVDTIRDFGGGDRIGLSSGVFAAATDGGIGAGEFVLGAAAQDADDRLVYDQASGRLFYDADGNGATAAMLFAQLAAGTVLAATDFVVVAPVTP